MRYILILFITLSATFCHAQRVTFNKGGTTSKNYYEEIPYEFVNGYIFVTPEINGIKRKFIFDTGAPVQITSELFNELKPAIINRTEISDAAGNKDHSDIVSIKEIKLNSLSFTGIPALVTNAELYTCFHIDGIIGSNLLRNAIVRIDPVKHVIIFTDDAAKLSLNKETAIKLTTGEPQSYPYFMIEISGEKPQIVGFDSGSPYFLVMAEPHAKKFMEDKLSAGYGSNRMSLLGLQKKDSLYRLRLPSVNIAGSTFTNVITETNKSNRTRVGNKLLNYGTVTLDFINERFYFDPISPNNDINEQSWPLKPMVSDKKLIVGVVWEKLKGQINSGDQIMAIDNEPCDTMNLCDWLNGKSARMMNKQTATLSIKDEKGNIQKINISKE